MGSGQLTLSYIQTYIDERTYCIHTYIHIASTRPLIDPPFPTYSSLPKGPLLLLLLFSVVLVWSGLIWSGLCLSVVWFLNLNTTTSTHIYPPQAPLSWAEATSTPVLTYIITYSIVQCIQLHIISQLGFLAPVWERPLQLVRAVWFFLFYGMHAAAFWTFPLFLFWRAIIITFSLQPPSYSTDRDYRQVDDGKPHSPFPLTCSINSCFLFSLSVLLFFSFLLYIVVTSWTNHPCRFTPAVLFQQTSYSWASWLAVLSSCFVFYCIFPSPPS